MTVFSGRVFLGGTWRAFGRVGFWGGGVLVFCFLFLHEMTYFIMMELLLFCLVIFFFFE